MNEWRSDDNVIYEVISISARTDVALINRTGASALDELITLVSSIDPRMGVPRTITVHVDGTRIVIPPRTAVAVIVSLAFLKPASRRSQSTDPNTAVRSPPVNCCEVLLALNELNRATVSRVSESVWELRVPFRGSVLRSPFFFLFVW